MYDNTNIRANSVRAVELLAACNKSLKDNEANIRSVAGVRCSYSDVETIALYCEAVITFGTWQGALMRPRCEVVAVLERYGLA